MSDDDQAKSLRDLLAPCLGARLVDITLPPVFEATDEASPETLVCWHFDNGTTVQFWINEVEGVAILDSKDT